MKNLFRSLNDFACLSIFALSAAAHAEAQTTTNLSQIKTLVVQKATQAGVNGQLTQEALEGVDSPLFTTMKGASFEKCLATFSDSSAITVLLTALSAIKSGDTATEASELAFERIKNYYNNGDTDPATSFSDKQVQDKICTGMSSDACSLINMTFCK